MNKELEALERLKKYFKNNCVNDWEYNDDFKYKDDLNIIETALKDFKKLMDTFPMVMTHEDLKKLKAFDIIKEKGVDILKLKECKRCKKPDEYNKRTSYSYHKMLTQDEYDLLKEILL